MKNYRISDNFMMSEFEVSDSYPHLVEPVPPHLQVNVLLLVCKVLQPICTKTGWRDKITSGYRPLPLNRAVGGVPTSQHVKAEAADNQFYINGRFLSSFEVTSKVRELKLEFDQMILYPTFVHISYSKDRNRNQLLYSSSYRGKRL